MAERMVVNVGRCMPLADGLTPLQGSVVEPLSFQLLCPKRIRFTNN
jgi:hypothetical protein